MPLKSCQRSQEKIIRDNVHEIIKVDPLTVKFLDTTQFQRLREVKQLGLCSLVFPGATHSRLEHSLGVYKLARSMVRQLAKYWPELDIDESDLAAVSLAGLLHDVGHGPFSHAFENEFLPRILPGGKWHHEDMSGKLVDYIVDVNHIDVEADIMKRVKDYILCSPRRMPYGEKAFLFDIVANGRNGLDVDKLDYITRDSRSLSLTSEVKYCKRLMNNTKVIDNEICYRAGTENDICELFDARASLFRDFYTHADVKAMELMLADALVLADGYMGISAHVHEPEAFCRLDDSILRAIETSTEAELKDARELLWRMRIRGTGMYRCCREFVVPAEHIREFKAVRAEDVVCCATNGAKLDRDDIVVSNVKIDMTCGKANVLEGVHFFSEFESLNKFGFDPRRVSNRYAQDSRADMIVRVFVKKQELFEAGKQAFDEYLRRTF